jgi:hypothetical protein
MTSRLPLFVGALAGALALGPLFEQTAEAGRRGGARFSGSAHWNGGVRVTAGSSFRFSRPAWRSHRWNVGGSIYVGAPHVRYYYPSPYYVYYPQYVPAYYHTTSYYPVAPEPALAAPGVVAVAAVVPPPLPRFGVGLFAGGVNVDSAYGSQPDSSDFGLLARYRLTPGLIVEGELGKTSYDVADSRNLRVDRRLSGSLLYEIGARNRLAPYLLVGVGAQQADVAGDYSTTQNFAEIGAGLRLAVTPRLHVAFDLRAGSRHTIANDEPATVYGSGTAARTIAPPTSDSGESEEYTRARLSAILYF